MKRLFDIVLGISLLCFLGLFMVVIALLVRFSDRGFVFFWSARIGKNNVIFKMPKFRTMRQGTPAVATHLLNNPGKFVTPIGQGAEETQLG
jgi:O-antigen biosynthesis protein WbqP